MKTDAFDDAKIFGVENRTQVINLLVEYIDSLEEQLGEFPSPADPINGPKYIRWERVTMAWIGKVTGALEVFKLVGVLPPTQHAALKLRATAAISALMTNMVMTGSRR